MTRRILSHGPYPTVCLSRSVSYPLICNYQSSMLDILVVLLVALALPIFPPRRRDSLRQRRQPIGRVHLLLAPCRVPHGTREEGLHSFDGDAFCLGDPDECKDTECVSLVSCDSLQRYRGDVMAEGGRVRWYTICG